MSDSSDKRKKAGIAAVFWIVLALILLIVFLVNQDNIVRILKETEFFVHVFGEQPAFIENYNLPEQKEDSDDIIVLGEKEAMPESIESETITLPEIIDSSIKESIEEEPTNIESIEPKEEIKEDISISSTVETQEEKPEVVQTVTSKQSLYFVFVNGDGTVERKESTRVVPKSTTPLTASLQALLAGPNSDEKSKDYMSFIPSGTRLLSVSIQDGTALVNLSEEFSFNQYGVDGYLAQLMQVVYTATAFSTIKNVRFFIEGEQSSYLGNDGVWIGSPLSRTDFK